MRKKWFALGCLTSIVIVVALLFLGITSLKKLGQKKQVKISANSYLHLDLRGEITDYSVIKADFFNEYQPNAHDIIQKINRAKYDDNIVGIVLEPFGVSVGYATAHEIMKALQDFKTANKPIYAYLEMGTNKDYFLCSVADKIIMNPSSSGGLFLTGVGSNTLFYKDLLKKIGVEVNVVQAGKFKGAGEMFSRSGMSDALRNSLTTLYADVYNQMIKTLANNRNMPLSEMKNIYEKRDKFIVSEEYALDLNLIDDLQYKKDFYKDNVGPKDKLVPYSKYKNHKKPTMTSYIAVVYAQGNISKKMSKLDIEKISASRYNKILDKLKKNKSVKAIVIRINSPGGSALESDIIYDKIQEIRKYKPVVISMGNVAASGGYYISCASDYIYADKFTITGSIGVISMLPNFSELSDKIGVNSEEINYGKYTNFLNPWNKVDSNDLEQMRYFSQKVYNEFKQRVANGRDLSLAKVEEVAQGRVWSSHDAKNIQLVDAIGNLEDAIDKASEIANIPTYSLKFYPKQKSITELFLEERFNLSNMSETLIKNEAKKIKVNKALETYQLIREYPVQMLSPIHFEDK